MKITTELIENYFQGKCSTQEAEFIESFLKNNPDYFSKIFPSEEWKSIELNESYTTEDSIFKELSNKLYAKHKLKRIIEFGTKAAAIIVIIGVSYYFSQPNPTDTTHFESAINTTTDNIAVPNLYYINSDNRNIVINVSDGSYITLFPKSEVRFAESFSHSKERKIELKGKAKFEVAKDRTKPFKVYTNGILTTALGTVFIVDELADAETKINLLHGSIEIMTLNNVTKPIKRIIKPDESLQINHQNAMITEEVRINNNTKNRAGFYHHTIDKIVIKNSSLAAIIHNLEQNFNIKLNFDSLAIKDKYYSGTFKNKDNSYKEIIKEINYLHKILITEKNNLN